MWLKARSTRTGLVITTIRRQYIQVHVNIKFLPTKVCNGRKNLEKDSILKEQVDCVDRGIEDFVRNIWLFWIYVDQNI